MLKFFSMRENLINPPIVENGTEISEESTLSYKIFSKIYKRGPQKIK